MIFWVSNAIGTSIRIYAHNNRYPWTPSHDRGGRYIPWEIPDQWVNDLRRTFRGRR
jgi:hypothetical protein